MKKAVVFLQIFLVIALIFSMSVSCSKDAPPVSGYSGADSKPNAEPGSEPLSEQLSEPLSEPLSETPPEFSEPVEELIKIEIALSEEQKIRAMIEDMTTEQKIGQMFFQAFRRYGGKNVTEVNDFISDTIKNYNLGGVILFSENIRDSEQVRNYIKGLQDASDIPLFIGVDEEGGRVLRTQSLDVPRIPNALDIGKTGDPQNAYSAAQTIAGYLKPLDFNVNFAPVADVFTNPGNTVIGSRAFSSDPHEAGKMAEYFIKGLHEGNILATVKHFPGHGDTKEDSHHKTAVTYKTLEELLDCEFIPFQSGINAGVDFVMTGHISAPNVTGDDLPATFSRFLLNDVLRNTLNFKGIVITDSLEMGAITNYYTPAETAVNAISAGVDMLLDSPDLNAAYTGVTESVKNGTIPEDRIDDSVARIFAAKSKAGLIKLPENEQFDILSCEINGEIYLNIHDISRIADGIGKQFEIAFDGEKIHGGANPDIDIEISLNGEKMSMTVYVYNANDNNYFRPDDIAQMLKLKYEWNAVNKTVVIETETTGA